MLQTGIAPYLDTISNSLCLYNGVMMEDDEQLGEANPGKGKKSSIPQIAEPYRVQVQLLGKVSQ